MESNIPVLSIDQDLQTLLSANSSANLIAGPEYSKAMYLMWQGYGPIVLLNRDQSPQPWALVVDCTTLTELQATDVFIQHGHVMCGEWEIVIHPDNSAGYDSNVPNLSNQWNPVNITQAQAAGWGEYSLTVFSHLGSVGDAIDERVSRLLQGLSTMNVDQVRVAVRGLVGLGYGSTPSGDDFLTAFLGVLSGVGLEKEFGLLSHVVGELPLLEPKLTTVPGGVALWHACHGRFAKVIIDALLAINGLGDVTNAFDRLIHTGHTSGRDILAGLIIGSMWSARTR